MDKNVDKKSKNVDKNVDKKSKNEDKKELEEFGKKFYKDERFKEFVEKQTEIE